MGLRRAAVVLEEPQFAVSRTALSRRSSSNHRGRQHRMDATVIDGGRRIPGGRPPARHFGLIGLVVVLFVLLIGVSWASSILIEYSWWKEVGQVHTWFNLYAYSTLPVAAGTVLAWI